MTGLDTNVLVRYLVQDDAPQAALATRLIERQCSAEAPGFINSIVLCELVWVLSDIYEHAKADLLVTLERLLRSRELRVQDSDLAWEALRAWRGSKADFADCLIAAYNKREACAQTLTFDKQAALTAHFKLLR